MATIVEYSWSWTTASFIVLSAIADWVVRTRIKTHHLEVFHSLGLSKRWGKREEEGSEYTSWLFTFRYLSLNDNTLTFYCLLSKILYLITIYFFFTEPIFYESVTTP